MKKKKQKKKKKKKQKQQQQQKKKKKKKARIKSRSAAQETDTLPQSHCGGGHCVQISTCKPTTLDKEALGHLQSPADIPAGT